MGTYLVSLLFALPVSNQQKFILALLDTCGLFSNGIKENDKNSSREKLTAFARPVREMALMAD